MKIEDKLLSGYFYRNSPLPKTKGQRQVNINTGVGGAKMMVDAYREDNIPDSLIETFIEVFIHGQWVKLSDVKIKNIKSN